MATEDLKKKVEVDWLKLEQRIRQALRDYRDYPHSGVDAWETLEAIDEALGDETGRGCELS